MLEHSEVLNNAFFSLLRNSALEQYLLMQGSEMGKHQLFVTGVNKPSPPIPVTARLICKALTVDRRRLC